MRSPLLFKKTLSWLQLEGLDGWSRRGDTSAMLDRLTHPHSHMLYKEVSGAVYRFYRQLLRPDHPLATAVAADMKSFKAAREAGGLSRTELWHSFREQRLSVQWDEQIIGRIVGFSQSGRSTELPIKQTAIELLAIVFSAWGTTPEISQAVAEEAVKDFQFEQGAGLIGKAGLTGWGKYMLPFWSCGVLALSITLYVFVREVYLGWMENFFFYDEFTIFEHLNPDYYGRMCKSAFSALMYDKINWNDTRFLLQFVINMRRPSEKGTTNQYKRAFLLRFRNEENDYNKSHILSVDPLSPIGVELAVRVLRFCNFETLLRVSAVCRTWRFWCSNDHVWREATKNVEGFLPYLGGAFSLFRVLHYRLPPTAKGRALYYAKHLQTRQPLQFQERLLNLVDADFLAGVKERQQAASEALAASRSRASTLFRNLGGKLVENVQSMLASEPIIIAVPFDIRDREANVSLQFSSQSFGVIDVDVIERIVPAAGSAGQAEDVSLASGQVHLPYLVHSLMQWKETAPMWGEGGGPQIYVEGFLRWIERKFWAYWWPRRSGPVGLSLDDFIAMTWGVVESEHEMDDSVGSTEAPIEAELGLDIAPPDRRERGVLLARNGRFLAVDLQGQSRQGTCMRIGGAGPELVWLASRHNRVASTFTFRSAATGQFLVMRPDGAHTVSHQPGTKDHLWRREGASSKRGQPRLVLGEEKGDGSFRWRAAVNGRPLLEPQEKGSSSSGAGGGEQDPELWQMFFVEPRRPSPAQ